MTLQNMTLYLIRGEGNAPDTPFNLDAIRFYVENYYAFEQQGKDVYRSEDGGFIFLHPKKIQYFGLPGKLEYVLNLLTEPSYKVQDSKLEQVTDSFSELKQLRPFHNTPLVQE